jgi:hypothetical protein
VPRAGVGEKDVEPSVSLLDRRDETIEVLEIADVAADADGAVSDRPNRRVELRLTTTRDDDPRTLAGEAHGGRETDP